MNSNSDENLIKSAIKFNAYCKVKEAIKQYGLEMAEDKIIKIYQHQPKIKDLMLRTLYEIWKG